MSTFSERFIGYRKAKGLSQQDIAKRFGISVQAVSKWECAQCYPDIELLENIADLFEVSIDSLLRKNPIAKENDSLPDDNILRVVQYIGKNMISIDECQKDKRIMLQIEKHNFRREEIHVQIYGNADIKGDIKGNVTANKAVNCKEVGQSVSAGDYVNCGSVGQSVEAGGGVNCGPVGQCVEAGGGVTCGPVGQSVGAGGDVCCGVVGSDVKCEGDLSCGNIGKNVSCEGNIKCKIIKGDVQCEGNITYEK